MKYLKLLTIFLVSLCFTNCSVDDNDVTIRDMVFGEADPLLATAKNYNAYGTANRQNVLLENFDNNNRNWPVGYTNQSYFRLINAGVYHLMGFSGTSVTNSGFNTLPLLNSSGNYEIEIAFRIIQNGTSGYKYKFTFASASNSYNNRIEILNDETNGNFNISNFPANDPNRNRYFDTNLSYNSPNGFDKLTIRKVSNKWFVFFNGNFIKQLDSLNIATSYFDFYTGKEAQIDYIKFDNLINL
jgi:hypothetical protein